MDCTASSPHWDSADQSVSVRTVRLAVTCLPSPCRNFFSIPPAAAQGLEQCDGISEARRLGLYPQDKSLLISRLSVQQDQISDVADFHLPSRKIVRPFAALSTRTLAASASAGCPPGCRSGRATARTASEFEGVALGRASAVSCAATSYGVDNKEDLIPANTPAQQRRRSRRAAPHQGQSRLEHWI